MDPLLIAFKKDNSLFSECVGLPSNGRWHCNALVSKFSLHLPRPRDSTPLPSHSLVDHLLSSWEQWETQKGFVVFPVFLKAQSAGGGEGRKISVQPAGLG